MIDYDTYLTKCHEIGEYADDMADFIKALRRLNGRPILPMSKKGIKDVSKRLKDLSEKYKHNADFAEVLVFVELNRAAIRQLIKAQSKIKRRSKSAKKNTEKTPKKRIYPKRRNG